MISQLRQNTNRFARSLIFSAVIAASGLAACEPDPDAIDSGVVDTREVVQGLQTSDNYELCIKTGDTPHAGTEDTVRLKYQGDSFIWWCDLDGATRDSWNCCTATTGTDAGGAVSRLFTIDTGGNGVLVTGVKRKREGGSWKKEMSFYTAETTYEINCVGCFELEDGIIQRGCDACWADDNSTLNKNLAIEWNDKEFGDVYIGSYNVPDEI